MQMRLSQGTAAKLGFLRAKQLAMPTTCYVLLGDKCGNNCLFCAQTVSGSKLSRIDWPEFPADEIIEGINASDFRRVCLQCSGIGIKDVKKVAECIDKPVSVSYNFRNVGEIRQVAPKVDRICIPIDAANSSLFHTIKHSGFAERLELVELAAKEYPGRITTHLIVGLGETESEMKELIRSLTNAGVTVGLFAFTPLKGTRLEHWKAPSIGYYRRVQAELFKTSNNTEKIFPEAFMTSGCACCNRPYYNERPGGQMYNYPRALKKEEFQRCKHEMASDI